MAYQELPSNISVAELVEYCENNGLIPGEVKVWVTTDETLMLEWEDNDS